MRLPTAASGNNFAPSPAKNASCSRGAIRIASTIPGKLFFTPRIKSRVRAFSSCVASIDLLVQEGFYSNRTDFIRTAIRNHLMGHAEAVRQTIARKTLVLGLQEFSRRDLERVRKTGSKLRIHVLGLVRIATDVSPALARDTIESVEVLGALHASPAVKAGLADRIIWKETRLVGFFAGGEIARHQLYGYTGVLTLFT
jgi:Arc/MetJ-type ribon-helix-helix transcriptional regulator